MLSTCIVTSINTFQQTIASKIGFQTMDLLHSFSESNSKALEVYDRIINRYLTLNDYDKA